VQGFLLAGHVCAVMGYHEYPSLAGGVQDPDGVTGFEPLDIVQGILKLSSCWRKAKWKFQCYTRAVTFEGLRPAQKPSIEGLHGM
jgi:hydrogenase expression/formation protein HypD